MKLKKVNDEIYYSTETVTRIDSQDITFLKEKAVLNLRKRVRICTHPDADDTLHEMFIALVKDVYFPPHKHQNKSESFHIIEGKLKVIIFDDSGNVTDSIDMGDYFSGKKFYYRLSKPFFHTIIPISKIVVFQEITNGPFIKEDCMFAQWAPDETSPKEQKAYFKKIEEFEKLGV